MDDFATKMVLRGCLLVGLLGGCVVSNDEYLRRQVAPLAERAFLCPQTDIFTRCDDQKCYFGECDGCGRAGGGTLQLLGNGPFLNTPTLCRRNLSRGWHISRWQQRLGKRDQLVKRPRHQPP